MGNRPWRKSTCAASRRATTTSSRSSTASTWRSPTASSSSSSAPRAAASPRCCAWWPGLERITGGEVAIGDRVVNQLEPKDRDIAMVFQNYALYPHMSVYENMAYGLKIRGMSKDEIDSRVRKAAKILELGTLPGTQAAPALGRPAPARRHGPRHRARARGVPVRRAAQQPRRQAAGCRCGSRSSACSASWPSPRSTSPTTRSRR